MVQTGAASGIAYPLCPARQDVERTDTATRGIVPHDTTRAHDSNAARVRFPGKANRFDPCSGDAGFHTAPPW